MSQADEIKDQLYDGVIDGKDEEVLKLTEQGLDTGIPAAEIHDLARVTTVADVFHALTSVRPYRTPMTTDEACKFLADQSGKLFDPDMAKCWISKMKAGVCV